MPAYLVPGEWALALSGGIKNAKHPVKGCVGFRASRVLKTALFRPEASIIFLTTEKQSLGQQSRVRETGNQEEMRLKGQEKDWAWMWTGAEKMTQLAIKEGWEV